MRTRALVNFSTVSCKLSAFIYCVPGNKFASFCLFVSGKRLLLRFNASPASSLTRCWYAAARSANSGDNHVDAALYSTLTMPRIRIEKLVGGNCT